MNTINSSDSIGSTIHSNRSDKSRDVIPGQKKSTHTDQLSPVLPNLGNLAKEVESSGEDIRSEVVEHARKLLDDPDWLSDYNIDGLANKLIDIEKI